MIYRPDIDGLRALAVLPVIFFHAGFEIFKGGYVGVDIFFVISGYLITTIILSEIEQEKFSILKFYERRARRILPALFLVMAVSLVLGYFWLMPDEYKNLGQSVAATTLFSNNILLGLTSGYWDLASEFKPLLHTWSLGVEEQYYLIVPILFMLVWKFSKIHVIHLVTVIFLGSLFFAGWFVNVSPQWAFYILPARAWEICLGALAAMLTARGYLKNINHNWAHRFSFLGFLLILISIFAFDERILSPGFILLLPTVGAVLIIVFTQADSLVYKFLANRVIIFLGLISYSLYLWHQPIFSFLRIYSVDRPQELHFVVALLLILILSILSWKFVELPFRNKNLFKTRTVFMTAGIASFVMIIIGFYLNKNYGIPSRVFDKDVSISDLDKRIYNERAFKYKVNFSVSDREKILIIGNSFARDFINITLETFDVSNIQIAYTDDLNQCIASYAKKPQQRAFLEANVIVFASGSLNKDCYRDDIKFAKENRKKIYYIGFKDFGYNLNWLIRLSAHERKNKFNSIPPEIIEIEKDMASVIPPENYISLLAPVVVDGKIPITDDAGRLISPDRTHLTKYGAIYFGKKAVASSSYAELFN